MTQHDNLFQEVDEDLERQKLEAVWKKYGALIIAGAIAVVLGTGAYTTWNTWHDKKNEEATSGLTVLDQNKADPVKQIAALEGFAQKDKGETQAAFAQIYAAALAEKQGDKAKAVQMYDAVAEDTKNDIAFRQFADLMSVRAQIDSGDPARLSQRLDPLATTDAPWRFTAMEYQGYLALKSGDKAKAKQLFTSLSQNAMAPRTLSIRAGDMLRYIGD